MVGAGTGSFARESGNIITTILDAVADTIAKQQGTELKSTEDMLAELIAVNKKDNLEDLVIWSSDVVSLYPSLQPKRSAAIAKNQLLESGLELIGTHWKEAALYLALTLPKIDPNRQRLEGVIPSGRRRVKPPVPHLA